MGCNHPALVGVKSGILAKFSSAEPIELKLGERVRFILVNDTMMAHPIHLHGLWSELENGNGELRPYKHTINVKGGERLSYLVSADTPGRWAYHCMEAGMFRAVIVSMSALGYAASWPRRIKLLAAAITAAITLTCIGSAVAPAQPSSPSGAAQGGPTASWEPPMMDNPIIWHLLFDQFERTHQRSRQRISLGR